MSYFRASSDSPLLDVVAGLIPLLRQIGREPISPAKWRFTETPESLVESWSESQRLEAATKAGDVVVATDRGGLAGVFAVAQAARAFSERRRVVVVAGESHLLEHLWVAGTLDGVEPAWEAAVDWEIALYRHAAALVTPAPLAASLLARFGLRSDVIVIDVAQPAVAGPAAGDGGPIWLPEPQSRRAQTGTILRALADLPADVVIHMNPDAESDRVWVGTTRDAVAAMASMLGSRVEARSRAPRRPSFVVLGDPFAVPGRQVAHLRDRGVPVIVPKDSVASALWPDSATWSGEDGLQSIISGWVAPGATVEVRPTLTAMLSSPGVEADPTRARSVSVGVPVFRDVRFLDDCVESIVGQTEPAGEIILIDDGSHSDLVDAALSDWEARVPQRIRVLRQPNRGVCVARNTMLEAMLGDAFVLVDADDALAPTFIEQTAGALRANPGLDAIATWTEFFGDYAGVEGKPPFDARVGRRENPIVSTGVLVDMSIRDRGIRFSPDLAFIYCEDWDFWAQIVAAGGKFGLVPDPLVRHRVHRDSGASRRTELAHRIGKARATTRLWRV